MKITNGAKVFGMKDTPYGKRVDVSLCETKTSRDIFWSPRWEAPKSHGGMGGFNSYVVFADDDGIQTIASINGYGEVRWTLTEREFKFAFDYAKDHPNPNPWDGDWVEQLKVAAHFGVLIDR